MLLPPRRMMMVSWFTVFCLPLLLSRGDAFLLRSSPAATISYTRLHSGTVGIPSRISTSTLSLSSVAQQDFSSPYYWEDFYQQLENNIENTPKNDENDTKEPSFVVEWHDSIPLEDLAALIPTTTTTHDATTNCLMVGCGTSLLPQAVLDRHLSDKHKFHLTLLDTSKTCVQQLQRYYKPLYGDESLSYVCASATDMSKHFLSNNSNNNQQQYFNVIVDKGLTDAFMCGEGWEKPVQDLLRESTKLFHPTSGGTYIMVSYKLNPTIQTLIQEMCNTSGKETNDDNLVWEWDFNIQPLSNDRVSVSVATVRQENTFKSSHTHSGKRTRAAGSSRISTTRLSASSSSVAEGDISAPSEVERKPIKKIAIIGAGIAGLATAHALTAMSPDDNKLDMSLYDARSNLNPQDGAGIQLNGGLTAIGKFNKKLQQAIMEAGLPLARIESRTKAWKDPSPTNYDTLFQVDIDDLVRKAGGKVTEGLVQDNKVLWTAIMRGALQVCAMNFFSGSLNYWYWIL